MKKILYLALIALCTTLCCFGVQKTELELNFDTNQRGEEQFFYFHFRGKDCDDGAQKTKRDHRLSPGYEVTPEERQRLTHVFCGFLFDLQRRSHREKTAHVFEIAIAKEFCLSPSSPTYYQDLIHASNLILRNVKCGSTDYTKSTTRLFAKEVFARNFLNSIMYNFFLSEGIEECEECKEATLDFNTIEVINGKEETMLDYLYSVIDDRRYDSEEIELLIGYLRESFGAKKASELK